MSSAGVDVEVECDGCRRVECFRGDTAEAVAGRIDEAGWLRNRSRDQDICPSCVVTRAGYFVDKVLL